MTPVTQMLGVLIHFAEDQEICIVENTIPDMTTEELVPLLNQHLPDTLVVYAGKNGDLMLVRKNCVLKYHNHIYEFRGL